MMRLLVVQPKFRKNLQRAILFSVSDQVPVSFEAYLSPNPLVTSFDSLSISLLYPASSIQIQAKERKVAC
ncbi:hypothetical protein EI94DRAFT_731778 [Lactarius quietus]|nr:hypothetical protein EI94DRAFT_731778 [Lactarius quietus]